MKADDILARFEKTYAEWRARLDPLDDEAFARTPEDGGWSVARVCGHVGDVGDMLLGNAELLTKGDGEERGFSLMPAFLCLLRSFPPMRIKVPDTIPDDLQHLANPSPLSKADALARLDAMAERMRALEDPVAKSSPKLRRAHPAGGHPNANQWYHMNEMHLRHHLRQLRRLTTQGPRIT